MRLPEVRHNLRLITEAATRDLDSLAREANQVQMRRKAIEAEDQRLKKQIEDEAHRKRCRLFVVLQSLLTHLDSDRPFAASSFSR